MKHIFRNSKYIDLNLFVLFGLIILTILNIIMFMRFNALAPLLMQTNVGWEATNYLDIYGMQDGILDEDGNVEEKQTYVCSGFIDIKELIDGRELIPLQFISNEWCRITDYQYAIYDKDYKLIRMGMNDLQIGIIEGDVYLRISFSKYTVMNNPMLLNKSLGEKIDGTKDLDSYIPFKKDIYIQDMDIVFPEEIILCDNIDAQIFHDNILMGCNGKSLSDANIEGIKSCFRYSIIDHEIISNEEKEKNIRCNVVFEPLYETRGQGAIGQALDGNQLIKSFNIKVISHKIGNKKERKVMLFGDSITANGSYPLELMQLFDKDSMKIELLGTIKNMNINYCAHEGRGGWSAYKYLTSKEYNGCTNAFLNPESGKFDFSYYMDKNNYDKIDDFVLLLGINDINDALYPSIIGEYNQIIDSVREFDKDCNILIGLCILPCEADYAIYSSNTSAQREKNRRLGLWKALIDEYDNREKDGIFIMPIGACIDTVYDFDYVQEKLSSRNENVLIDCPADHTHPSLPGYRKIADIVYGYLKYMEYLGR